MWLAGIRDAAIVLLALESVVIGVLLATTLIQIRKLVKLLRDEVVPMLDSANETVNTVKGTTSFLSDYLVQPVVKISGYAAGTAEALRSFLALRRDVQESPARSVSDLQDGRQGNGSDRRI